MPLTSLSQRNGSKRCENITASRGFSEKETKIRNSQQQRRFKENPMKFGKELFQKRNFGEPKFTSQIALDYFAKLYRDEQRDFSFTPLPEMVRPSPPTHILSENAPTQEEIMQVLRLKRNGAAPGPNGISYLPYKRCPALWPYLHTIFSKIWKTNDVPKGWASASIILLPKSDKTADPAEFRLIAFKHNRESISPFLANALNVSCSNKFTSHTQKGLKLTPRVAWNIPSLCSKHF